MPILYTYAHSRPSDEQICKELIAERPYMYITATKALARERRKLIPDYQKSEQDRKSHALFGDFLRHLLRKANVAFATRGEEKTCLQRALKIVAAGDQTQLDLLRKDAGTLLRVMYDLAAQGIDLRKRTLPSAMEDQLVNKQLGKRFFQIQAEFYNLLNNENLALFDAAGWEFLNQTFAPKPVVLMEGFTFFTELQKLFIKACADRGSELYFIAPFHEAQAKGFEIIQRTYTSIPRLIWKTLKTEALSEHDDLRFLQNFLFANPTTNYSGDVSNLTLKQFPNRDREIQACIDQLRTWFEKGTYKPREVVVVMRRSKEFLDRFRDHLSMNPLPL